jgi:hypothetical protein
VEYTYLLRIGVYALTGRKFKKDEGTGMGSTVIYTGKEW